MSCPAALGAGRFLMAKILSHWIVSNSALGAGVLSALAHAAVPPWFRGSVAASGAPG